MVIGCFCHLCVVFLKMLSLTWTEPAGHRSRLVRSPGVHAAVGPSVGHHPFPDVFQLVLLHPAHLPAHLHGPHLALWPTIGEDSMYLYLCFMSKIKTNKLLWRWRWLSFFPTSPSFSLFPEWFPLRAAVPRCLDILQPVRCCSRLPYRKKGVQCHRRP